MKERELKKLRGELASYLDEMVEGMGRRERREALSLYLTGLLLDGERKSVQPMATRLAESPKEAEAMRQRMQQAVVVADWAESELYRRLALKVDTELPGIDALVVDDTGQKKSGKESVGVARQYSGTWGRTDNGQVAVSLHLAGEKGSAMIGHRLYLPKEWTEDRVRCEAAGVPAGVKFAEKWKLALQLIDEAREAAVREHVVLGDGGFGDIPEFRDGLEERELPYLLRVGSNHLVWPPGAEPRVPEYSGMGRPATRAVDAHGHEPVQIGGLAKTLQYKRVSWREGSRGRQRSGFAAVRVHMAEGHTQGRPPSKECWLLCEWPKEEKEPTKFYVSTLPSNTSLKTLVTFAKRRWRVERDYQELKGEIGLDHFEGRTWRGFHHHAALCALAHGFLSLRRALFPPQPREVDRPRGTARTPADSSRTHRHLPALQAHH
jgi:SRSO17 transposase